MDDYFAHTSLAQMLRDDVMSELPEGTFLYRRVEDEGEMWHGWSEAGARPDNATYRILETTRDVYMVNPFKIPTFHDEEYRDYDAETVIDAAEQQIFPFPVIGIDEGGDYRLFDEGSLRVVQVGRRLAN